MLNHRILAVAISCLLALAAFMHSSSAQASTGFVTGTLKFHNKNGSFCPSGQACTGATYDQNSFNVQLGIPEAEVRILRSSDNAVIGSGVTTPAGLYSASWNSPGAANVTCKIQVRYKHKDGRFFVHLFGNTPHQQLTSTGTDVTCINGKTSSNPQLLDWYWGTSASPNPVANVYWAAWFVWDSRLRSSNRMLAYFTDVDILAFDTQGTTCSTSCARGWFKLMGNPPAYAEQKLTIILDGSARTPYSPQERTMHELGHIADWLSAPNQGILRDQAGADYGGNNNWSYTSLEWRPKALKEGIATFIATTALYDDFATDPRTCLADGNTVGQEHCFSTSSNAPTPIRIESSSYGACGALDGRQPVNTMRYMWDIYDQVNDSIETDDLLLAEMFDSVAAYPCPSWPTCYGNGEMHDQYTNVAADLSSMVDSVGERDDSNGWEYRNVMLNNYSGAYDVQNSYFNNCMGYF